MAFSFHLVGLYLSRLLHGCVHLKGEPQQALELAFAGSGATPKAKTLNINPMAPYLLLNLGQSAITTTLPREGLEPVRKFRGLPFSPKMSDGTTYRASDRLFT